MSVTDEPLGSALAQYRNESEMRKQEFPKTDRPVRRHIDSASRLAGSAPRRQLFPKDP